MAIARTGGATSVYVIQDADLKVNGGQFKLQDGGVIPVHSNRAGPIGRRPIRGGDAIPVYIVNSDQLSGPGQKFNLIKGHPRHVTSLIETARGIKGGTAIPVFPATYADKVLLTASSNLIAYWPLWETSGGIADDESGNSRLGIYNDVTLGQLGIGDGRTAPLFLPADNSFVNIYSAGIVSALNGSEGTLAGWFKVRALSVWSDATFRRAVNMADNDLSDRFILQKNGDAANRISLLYRAGGVQQTITKSNFNPTDWFHLAMTWSASSDEMKAYVNGVQEGATQNGLGVWGGILDATRTVIGATDTSPANVWDGFEAHISIWTIPLSQPRIANLAVV